MLLNKLSVIFRELSIASFVDQNLHLLVREAVFFLVGFDSLVQFPLFFGRKLAVLVLEPGLAQLFGLGPRLRDQICHSLERGKASWRVAIDGSLQSQWSSFSFPRVS